MMFHGWRATVGGLFAESSCPRLEGEVVPSPFGHDTDSVSGTDEEKYVDDTPECPGQEA